jgi:transcriptional regulator with XRE-family HTH domain
MAATLERLAHRTRLRRGLPPPIVARAIRLEAGVSIGDVAEVIGVTRQCVSLWERGERTPRGMNRERYVLVLCELRRAIDTDFPAASAVDKLAGVATGVGGVS